MKYLNQCGETQPVVAPSPEVGLRLCASRESYLSSKHAFFHFCAFYCRYDSILSICLYYPAWMDCNLELCVKINSFFPKNKFTLSMWNIFYALLYH